MNLARYEPTDLWSRMQQQLNELLRATPDFEASNVATSSWMPLVDIKEEPDRFLIKADIPGVKPEDIEPRDDAESEIRRGLRGQLQIGRASCRERV